MNLIVHNKTNLALAIAIFFWASAFVAIRVALQGFTPGPLALFRFLIASVCMLIVYWRLPQKENFKKMDFWLLLLFGAFGMGCYNVFLNYGELAISAGVSSFIVSQSPLITLVCAILFLEESFNWITLLGIFISVIGVALISFSHTTHLELGVGLIFIFLATLASGLYSVLQKPFLNKYRSLDVTIYIIWGGALGMLFYFPDLVRELKTTSMNALLGALYLGFFPTAIAYVAWGYALSNIPVSRCVNFLYFLPIIATGLGWIVLGEVPSGLAFLGGIIALIGVWIANRGYVKES